MTAAEHNWEFGAQHRGYSHVGIPPSCRACDAAPAVTKGDTIRIVPERGAERVMLVAHVEHHIITLTDLAEDNVASDPEE